MCLNTGTPKNINFSFETNGKLMALSVPIQLNNGRMILKGYVQWNPLNDLKNPATGGISVQQHSMPILYSSYYCQQQQYGIFSAQDKKG